jgi:hypothetical protein
MDWRTHDISNQIPKHSNYNLLASDALPVLRLMRSRVASHFG